MMKNKKAENITREELYQKFIKENFTLTELSEYFDVPVGTLRKKLSHFSISKNYSLIGENVSKKWRKNIEQNIYPKRSKESLLKAQKESVISRVRNTNLKLAKEGITKKIIHELYIEKNLSLSELGIKFNRNKNQIRKILVRFDIPSKTLEQIEAARLKGLEKFISDPDRVREHVRKTQSTIKELYGNRWYRQNSSSEEKEIISWLKSNYKNLKISPGDYSVITNPYTKAALQLDVYLSQIDLAIEYNGEYWHDRETYIKDTINNTQNSREKLKEILCNKKNIRLIHIWSSDWLSNKEDELDRIKKMIDKRLR